MGLLINRRRVITFETLERSFYHLPAAEAAFARCDACEVEVRWLRPSQVVAITGLTLREIFRRIEADTLHFTESAPDVLHICQGSLGSETRPGAK